MKTLSAALYDSLPTRRCSSEGVVVSTLNVRFGSQADICGAKPHVRFALNSARESGHGISKP